MNREWRREWGGGNGEGEWGRKEWGGGLVVYCTGYRVDKTVKSQFITFVGMLLFQFHCYRVYGI